MRLLLICAFLLSNCNPNPYNFDINDPQFSPPPGILGMGNSQSQFDKPSNRSQQNPQSTYGSQNNPQPLYESQQNPQSQYKEQQSPRSVYGNQQNYQSQYGNQGYGNQQNYQSQYGNQGYGNQQNYQSQYGNQGYGNQQNYESQYGNQGYGSQQNYQSQYNNQGYGSQQKSQSQYGNQGYGSQMNTQSQYGNQGYNLQQNNNNNQQNIRNTPRRNYLPYQTQQDNNSKTKLPKKIISRQPINQNNNQRYSEGLTQNKSNKTFNTNIFSEQDRNRFGLIEKDQFSKNSNFEKYRDMYEKQSEDDAQDFKDSLEGDLLDSMIKNDSVSNGFGLNDIPKY